jgi:peptidyl-dipeptidase Dcp
MHGMLSDVTYQRLAGTNVLKDFVELPSQLFEHWLSEPVVLKKHAKHVTTGLPIPDELLAKIMNARSFNQVSIMIIVV